MGGGETTHAKLFLRFGECVDLQQSPFNGVRSERCGGRRTAVRVSHHLILQTQKERPTVTERRKPSHHRTLKRRNECIFGNILLHGEASDTALTPRPIPSLCVCTVNRFGTSSWDEWLLSGIPAGVSTSNARTSTDLHAQAQMHKVYQRTRPHIKHKEPLSDILKR